MKKFHAKVKLLCFIYCKVFKKQEAKTKYQVHNLEYIFAAASLLGQKERLAASQTPSILPSSFFLASHVDSVYLLICVASELLWHAAAPPGSFGDTIGLGDFGFLATAVKLHSDDETAVQLCLQLTVGCWCLCGSVRGWGEFSLMKEQCKCASLAQARTSSHWEAIVTVICLCMCVFVRVCFALYRLISPHHSLMVFFNCLTHLYCQSNYACIYVCC